MVKEKNENETEEKEQVENINRICLGDIEVLSSKGSLNKCVATAEKLLKSKNISNYLNCNYPKKKFTGIV